MPGLIRNHILTLFIDPRGFAFQLSQVVQFGSSDLPGSQSIDAHDSGRVKRKDSFDANPFRNFPHGKRCIHALALFLYHHPFKNLSSFFVPFDDFDMNRDRIARAKFRNA